MIMNINWKHYGAEIAEKDGVFYQTGEGDSSLFDTERAPADFVFEADIKLKKDGKAGMYFRCQGRNGAEWLAGYYFCADAGDNSVTLMKVNGGDRDNTELGRMRYPFEKDKWYRMRVEMSGKIARLYFNNFDYEENPYPKFDIFLGHFPRGAVGLRFGEGVAQFKNVSLAENTNTYRYDADTSYQNPIIYGADPDIMYHNGMYYLYFTDTQDMQLFQCYTSPDLVHWSEPQVVFHGEDGWGFNEYMSPNVIYKDGLFYMFYSSHTLRDENNKRKAFISYATSKSPLGPFKSELKLPLHSDIQEIGGHPFIDEDGRCYLTVVRFNHGNEIWAFEIKMENGIVTPLDDTLVRIMVPEEAWECDYARIVEGGVIFKHKGLYYMIYAGSHYKGSYAEGYAVAEKPLGPYKKYRFNPILRATYLTRGTGDSVRLQTPEGRHIMFYHQHFSTTEISPRYICMDEFKFVEMDGEPDILHVHGPTQTRQPKLTK